MSPAIYGNLPLKRAKSGYLQAVTGSVKAVQLTLGVEVAAATARRAQGNGHQSQIFPLPPDASMP